MILKKNINLFKLYKNVFYKSFLDNQCLSRIEDIDTNKKEIIIHTRGVNAPIHLGFEVVIKDEDFLNSFSSRHASFIGYYYGAYFYSYNKNIYQNDFFHCFKSDSSKSHTIHGIDRRGNLIYIDQTTGTENTNSPFQIMADKDLIIKFPPLQSCYIGILAGIYKSKSSKASVNYDVSTLKLV